MKKVLRFIPAVLIMSLIFYFSSLQSTGLAPTYFWNYIANKGAHLFWYFLLCLSFYYATGNIFQSIVFTILYGVTDEIHQSFVPNRTPSIRDIIIDSVGAVSAGILIYFAKRK